LGVDGGRCDRIDDPELVDEADAVRRRVVGALERGGDDGDILIQALWRAGALRDYEEAALVGKADKPVASLELVHGESRCICELDGARVG